MTRNRFLGRLVYSQEEFEAQRLADLAAFLEDRRAFLASGDCTDPDIRADITRTISDLEQKIASMQKVTR